MKVPSNNIAARTMTLHVRDRMLSHLSYSNNWRYLLINVLYVIVADSEGSWLWLIISSFIKPGQGVVDMSEVFIEFTDAGVVVYRPSSLIAVATVLTLEEALALARAEWPDFGIRVVFSLNVRAMVTITPPECAHYG